MNAIALSCITFVCISGGALLGMFLPGHHLSTEEKDVVRPGTGLIGTIAALVLGLLIASAKSSYDTQSTQITQMTSNFVLLDNLLAEYGPETNDVRNLLRRNVVVLADRMWRENSSDAAKAKPFEASDASDAFQRAAADALVPAQSLIDEALHAELFGQLIHLEAVSSLTQPGAWPIKTKWELKTIIENEMGIYSLL